MRIAARAQRIEPFHVMEVAKAARALEATLSPADAPMIYLNIGEPDFTAPPRVRAAAEAAIRAGHTQYTQATGIAPLRERIAAWYAQRFGVAIDAQRIIVTAGASAALQLACLALIEAGDEILMPDPSYPCNRQFVSAAEGTPVLVPTDAAQRFQLGAQQVREAWGARTRGVLLASPSNPTGTSIARDELRAIADTVRAHDGITLVDEIYLGLSHDDSPEQRFSQTALSLGEDIISINSFSKYFNMTGWRLGWLVVPPALVPAIERLAQNLFICPGTVSQLAALACFDDESITEYEARRAEFRARRDAFIPQLEAAGLRVPVRPDGAFYVWADCSAWFDRLGVRDSWDFSFGIMKRAHIAITPGRDFGSHDTARHVRFSTASSRAVLDEAAARLLRLWQALA